MPEDQGEATNFLLCHGQSHRCQIMKEPSFSIARVFFVVAKQELIIIESAARWDPCPRQDVTIASTTCMEADCRSATLMEASSWAFNCRPS